MKVASYDYFSFLISRKFFKMVRSGRIQSFPFNYFSTKAAFRASLFAILPKIIFFNHQSDDFVRVSWKKIVDSSTTVI